MNVLLFLCFIGSPQQAEVVAEQFVTPSRWRDNLDSIAVYHGKKRSLAIVTAKASHRLLFFDAVTGEAVTEVGGLGVEPGQLSRPNGVLVRDDLLFVVERDNHRVQVMRLPNLAHVGFIGTDDLQKPYGLDAYAMGENRWRLYVTDDYEGDETSREDFYTQRVKRFDFSVESEGLTIISKQSFGEKDGVGRLFKVESILADVAHDRLFICDEKGDHVGIKIYDLAGRFTGKMLDAVAFAGEPEGVALYHQDNGKGFLIVTDQQPNVSLFHIFQRNDLQHLGTFRGKVTANTDGIAIDSTPMGRFSQGGFWAIHDDQSLAGFSWETILQKVTAP